MVNRVFLKFQTFVAAEANLCTAAVHSASGALVTGVSQDGLGDVVERAIGPIGGDAFKTWYKKITGKDCGCGQRKQWLNERYPLKSN